jgi:5-oxoprolinase (ATP-hydrolysing) subunit A
MDAIDVNVEVGESFGRWPGGDDDATLDHASSVSVACGYHAGDHNSMLHLAELAAEKPVEVGAHPGYHDLMGFGYRSFDLPAKELRALMLYQIGALDAMLRSVGRRLHHVKPHGALYMRTLVDSDIAAAVTDAIASYTEHMVFYTTADTVAEERARQAGLTVIREFFADRPLSPDGTLLVNWATYFDPSPANAAARAVQFVTDGGVVDTIDGSKVKVEAECICLHSDNPAGAPVVAAVVDALRKAGTEVRAASRTTSNAAPL